MSQTWPGFDPDAFELPMIRVGRKGLNLVDAIDDLDLEELSRAVNVISRNGQPLEIRAGQTALATTSGTDHVHSLVRLNDPANSSFTRLAGSATNIYRGQSGALTLVDSGYSGDPLTFAAATSPTTGVPYVFVGDRTRNRKIARTGVNEAIGAAANPYPPSFLEEDRNKLICEFEVSDGTNAAAWTMTAGTDTAGAAAGAPTAADTADDVQFTTDPTGAGAGLGYFSTVSVAISKNLNQFASADEPVDDLDLMGLRWTVDRPDRLLELRVFFVCSTFTAGVIPGTNPTQNTDAFWKSFRPNDFTSYLDLLAVPASQSIATVGDNVRAQRLRDEFQEDRDRPVNQRIGVNERAQTELYRTTTGQLGAGRSRETFFGVVGNPLRRGDFARLGSDDSRGWDTITGIVIVIRTNTNQAIVVGAADWVLRGGGGPDTTEPGYQPYDFRYTNYNPATGVESNPSPVMDEGDWRDALRQPLNVVPAFGSGVATTWRQKFYRRGGSPQTSDNWYYDGINSSDGGAYRTTRTDAELLADGVTLEIDNDQPVTSVNSAGTTVLAKVVPIYFRLGDYMFALGDTNQPQRLYRSKRENFDAWPATEYRDVCAASDELMNGCEWNSGGYVFSRQRMYTVLLGLDGNWETEPTACNEGQVGRWGLCPTPFGIAFVSPFGVRLTTGGAPKGLSDGKIDPLFRGETVRGYSPIDFTVPTAIKLAFFDNLLFFTYQDTGGDRRQLVYSFLEDSWWSYLFGEDVSVVYNEPVQGVAASCLLGGFATGQVYTHSGYSDDGTAIAYTARTGATHFGEPALEKLLSNVRLSAELYTSTLTMQAFLNLEQTAVTAMTVTGTAGPKTYAFEPFGTTPQRARDVAIELRGNAPTDNRLWFNLLGVSRQLQPTIVFNEATPWEELPGGEGYLWGCIITCDTANAARTVLVEYTLNNGSVTTAATLTVTADGRKKLPFSWQAVQAQQVRIRPTGTCVEWIRYKIEWLSDPEPPRVPNWMTNWESFGSFSDKLLKGILLDVDTLGATKHVVVDVDQTSIAVNFGTFAASGRRLLHFACPEYRGRLFRLRSIDSNYGKLFSWRPIFDQEPLQLNRWELSELTHDISGWSKPLEAWICLLSSAQVTLTITAYNPSGTVLSTDTYLISSTGGTKQRRRVTLEASKGVLFTYLFTCASAFTLYREESEVLVEDWKTGEASWKHIFGNDDREVPPRAMGDSTASASTPNA